MDCKTTGQLIYSKVVTSFKLYNFLGSDGTILLGKRISEQMQVVCTEANGSLLQVNKKKKNKNKNKKKQPLNTLANLPQDFYLY